MSGNLKQKLSGGDLRSIGDADQIVSEITSHDEFDVLFHYMHDTDRLVVMRAADAIEKITLVHPEYLEPHKDDILELCSSVSHIELKWHLALLSSRLSLSMQEQARVFEIMKAWASDSKESRIVRVNALQSMHGLAQRNSSFAADFLSTLEAVQKENIPSINARIRRLNVSL